ncbi:uncharacterized protein TRIADDRAFT_62843, partial [Trichoplax adhaerens]
MCLSNGCWNRCKSAFTRSCDIILGACEVSRCNQDAILYELLADFICMEQMSIDIAYMSEFDPLWGNDKLNVILNPEAALFGNPIAQTACIFDCIKATTGFSSDMLFHCAGCNGSLYPFGGSIEHTQGGVQASTLIVERLLARLHRVGLAWDT